MKEVDEMRFTEEQIEKLMEAVQVERKDFSYFPGYAQTYWEPEEPESLEVGFLATFEGIQTIFTEEQIESLQELKKEPYFRNYCAWYLQEILKEKLYDDELTYWELHLYEEAIEIVREGNKLSIDVYYYE